MAKMGSYLIYVKAYPVNYGFSGYHKLNEMEIIFFSFHYGHLFEGLKEPVSYTGYYFFLHLIH